MLSYQHIYHAGNLADVHKHYLLAALLDYLARKDKPLTYIETHAGRGLYDLTDAAALKTGEAASGIAKWRGSLDAQHPYMRALRQVEERYGAHAYPGSPMLAAMILRPDDKLHLAELHPAEAAALQSNMAAYPVKCYRQDGFDLAHALCPPTPRRGAMLIDPSWEIKSDYDSIPRHISKLTRAWNVGIFCLWYPILRAGLHRAMLGNLERGHPGLLRSEVFFTPARTGHGMIGSGVAVVNPPYGLDQSAVEIAHHFAKWFPEAQGALN